MPPDAVLIAAVVVAAAPPTEAVVASVVDVAALRRLDPALHRLQCLQTSPPHGTRPLLSLELGTRSLLLKPAPARGARSLTRQPLKLRSTTQYQGLYQRCSTTPKRPPSTPSSPRRRRGPACLRSLQSLPRQSPHPRLPNLPKSLRLPLPRHQLPQLHKSLLSKLRSCLFLLLQTKS